MLLYCQSYRFIYMIRFHYLLFAIILLASGVGVSSSSAATYYVSQSGNDSNDGLTSGTAWQSLAQVGQYSSTTSFLPGDSVLFRRGDIWREQLQF